MEGRQLVTVLSSLIIMIITERRLREQWIHREIKRREEREREIMSPRENQNERESRGHLGGSLSVKREQQRKTKDVCKRETAFYWTAKTEKGIASSGLL